MIVDIWDKRIYYYDPLGKGFQNETAIKLCKLFFTAFFKWRKTCSIEIGTKSFISGFEVTWEETFPWQNDSASCGVFVLMYMSHKLGLLTFNPDIEIYQLYEMAW